MKKQSAVAVLILLALGGVTSSQFEDWPGGQAVGRTGDSIGFGDVGVGRTATVWYTFKVLETSETSVQVTIYDPCSPFGFSGLSSRSMTLAPGQSISFNVTFTPSQARDYACSFRVRASGGHPVQTTETVVRLSGRGVSGASGPSETAEPTTPGFPIGLPLVEEPSAGGEGIATTTGADGGFELTVPPATTVTGRITECGGTALVECEIRVAPVKGAYRISAEGYETALVEPIERISFMGMESVGLGDVCLQTALEEAEESPTGREMEESDECPCCEIVVEARMCCHPRGEYVEIDTIYQPQLVRIRVAYCEPPEELGVVDTTTLPLTSTGGVLWNPGLAPDEPDAPDMSCVGVQRISLDDAVLFEGDAVPEQTTYPGSSLLTLGAHTVRAVVGRVNGEECVCAKSFEVLPCPETNAALERTLDPESGCEPVRVSYDLTWPKGMGDICELFLDYADTHYLDRQDSLSFTDTVKPLDACEPRRVEPRVFFTTRTCCDYELAADPFSVLPQFRMTEDCICLRLVPNDDGTIATQLVFKWKSPTSARPGCILCENYDLLIDWGDGATSGRRDIVGLSPSQPDEYTVTHRYETDPTWDEQRQRFSIRVDISSDCDSLSKTFTTDCPFPTDLISEGWLNHIQDLSGSFTGPEDVYTLVNNLATVFDKVGEIQNGTTVCHVLLDVRLKGLDMGYYSDFDALVRMFNEDVAGGVFGREPDGDETGGSHWRFYPSSARENTVDYSSAKLVYRPKRLGESPYFALTILRGGCDDCPVLPKYRLVSTLTDIQAKRHVEEAEEGLENPSETRRSSFTQQASLVTLEIGLCCPPDLCEK